MLNHLVKVKMKVVFLGLRDDNALMMFIAAQGLMWPGWQSLASFDDSVMEAVGNDPMNQ